MLDNVYVRHHGLGASGPLDVGALVEASLFYGTTNLVFTRGSLTQMLRLYGADALIEFVSQGYVTPHYLESNMGVYTENTGTLAETHSAASFIIGESWEQDVVHTFRQVTERSGYGRRKASAFLDAVPVVRVTPEEFRQQVEADFGNEPLLRSAVTATAENLLGPGEGVPVQVASYSWADNKLRVRYDGEWETLRRAYRSQHGEDIGHAQLLASMVDTSADLVLASRLGSDISTGVLGSRLLQLKVAALQSAADQRWQGIADFQDHVLQGKQIREVVNSGERDLSEVMQLLDKSHKFREWLDGLPFDSDLVTGYLQEVTAETWADNLAAKTLRFAGTTFAGAALGGPIGTAIGLGIAVADEFLLDKILKGWKPNQFIEKRLNPFVSPPKA